MEQWCTGIPPIMHRAAALYGGKTYFFGGAVDGGSEPTKQVQYVDYEKMRSYNGQRLIEALFHAKAAVCGENVVVSAIEGMRWKEMNFS